MTDFSYQLYSSRNFPPLSDTLKMLSSLGYTGVEGYGALYADPAKVDELDARTSRRPRLDHADRRTSASTCWSGEPDRVLEIAKALGIETIYCPYLAARPAPRQRQGLGRVRRAAAGGGQALPRRRPRLRLAQPRLRVRGRPRTASCRWTRIFEGGPDLEWEADIAWVIKGGADPFHWIGALKRPHHRGARQGHRARGPERRRGRLGRRRPRHRGLAAADGGADADRRASTSSWSTTTRSDARRFAERSIAAAQSF